MSILVAAVGPVHAKRDKATQPPPNSFAGPKPAKPRIVPGRDPGGVAVALIGTGVNYTLPAIASKLARDGEGDIIGLDFIDRDNRPYDVAGPEASADGVRPHGTTLAAVLLGEPNKVRLVPVRVSPTEPRQLTGAAAFVAASPARIVLVALTGPNLADWEAFRQAAQAAPQVLFVLPAGDAGLNLDRQPVYPASLGLANAIVVTAVDAQQQRLAKDANSGPGTVDVAVPSAGFAAMTVDGAPARVTGSGYAAAWVAKVAAAMSSSAPGLPGAALKAKIVALAVPIPDEPDPTTRHGVIPISADQTRF